MKQKTQEIEYELKWYERVAIFGICVLAIMIIILGLYLALK